MSPLRAPRPLACLPKGSPKPEAKVLPLPFIYHPSPHAHSGLGEEGLKEGGFHVHIYLPFHIAPPRPFVHFYRGAPPSKPPSWLIKSSDWCCVPSLWPLCGGRGNCKGKCWKGTGRPRVYSWEYGVQQEVGQPGNGPGYLGRKEGHMLPTWLTAQVPPTCSCYLCVSHPLSFRVYFFMAQSPHSISKCPQNSWALLSRTLLPEPPAPG